MLWLHRLFNPHCEHCREEREESRVCSSCETLKSQLESVNHEKNKLLDRLLEKPVLEATTQPEREITKPINIPWNVRRQMLEREDRERARLIQNAPIPTEALERELDIASTTREAESR